MRTARLSGRVSWLLLAGMLGLTAQTRDQLDLLQDAGGWEYVSITDAGNGFETTHVCFDEHAAGQCKGKLTLGRDNNFIQSVSAEGKSLDRHGTYTIDGSSITFIDELQNKDGPYRWTLNSVERSLILETDQSGIRLKLNLLLEKEVQKRQEEKKRRSDPR